MSVVICGTVIPRTALSPDAVQALAASENPSLGGPSPPPSALVPPPPPRPSPPPNLHQEPHQHAMALDGSVPPPPPPPARPQRSPLGTQPPPPPPTAVVLGGTAAAPVARKRPASQGAPDNASAPPPPPSSPSISGPPKGSSPPKAWAPLALPSVETAVGATAAATTAAGADVKVDGGVSAADLAPYGEADLSMALTVPPERLQRSAAEANPFDDRFLVPVGAARSVREAVARLVSLANESGPEGRVLEVRLDVLYGVVWCGLWCGVTSRTATLC